MTGLRVDAQDDTRTADWGRAGRERVDGDDLRNAEDEKNDDTFMVDSRRHADRQTIVLITVAEDDRTRSVFSSSPSGRRLFARLARAIGHPRETDRIEIGEIPRFHGGTRAAFGVRRRRSSGARRR